MSNYRFITASDLNPTYCGFIPSWIIHHKKLFPKSEVKVILVSETLPNDLIKCKEDIILFKPLPNMQTSYQAQLVRMVYGALLRDNPIGSSNPSEVLIQNIICDMDMYILNKNILEMFNRIPNLEDRFINYGCLSMNECQREKQLPMFFSVYSKKIINNIFNVNNLQDVNNFLISNYKKEDNERGYNWFTDQLILYKKFIDYEFLYKIERQGGDRLDRDWFDPCNSITARLVNSGCIVDFHAPRPFNKYENFIKKVLSYVDFPEP